MRPRPVALLPGMPGAAEGRIPPAAQPRRIEQVCDQGGGVVDGLLDGGQQLGSILGEKASSVRKLDTATLAAASGVHRSWLTADSSDAAHRLTWPRLRRPLPSARASPDPRRMSRPRSALGGRGRPTCGLAISIKLVVADFDCSVSGVIDAGFVPAARGGSYIDAPGHAAWSRPVGAVSRTRCSSVARSAPRNTNRQTGPATQPPGMRAEPLGSASRAVHQHRHPQRPSPTARIRYCGVRFGDGQVWRGSVRK